MKYQRQVHERITPIPARTSFWYLSQECSATPSSNAKSDMHVFGSTRSPVELGSGPSGRILNGMDVLSAAPTSVGAA
jgi:hypothetical protein